jgi:hypothetical protein
MKMHKLSWLAVSVVLTVTFLLAACSVSNGGTTRQETEEPLQSSATPLSDTAETVSTPIAAGEPIRGNEVEVTVDKSAYHAGERLRFTITNHTDRFISYREGGCGWPFIVRLEGEDEVQLAINITEEEIPLRQLAAGETLSCDWNQIAWWNTGETGIMRFRTMNGSHQVPPGQYQVKFPYVLEEEDLAFSGDTWALAQSQVFTIE